jgi:hypothetical protein
MEVYSILVGKVYRTPNNELREVHAMDKGDVIYRDAAEHEPTKRIPLAQFAAEVESEVAPPP